jgi:hypothetical protein
VRAWHLDARGKGFEQDPVAFRVPIGPGMTGVLNVLAVSPDGKWIATSGLGITGAGSGFFETGRILPYLPPPSSKMLHERATIYLFDRQTRAVRVLQGHGGEVLALTFAPSFDGKPRSWYRWRGSRRSQERGPRPALTSAGFAFGT